MARKSSLQLLYGSQREAVVLATEVSQQAGPHNEFWYLTPLVSISPRMPKLKSGIEVASVLR